MATDPNWLYSTIAQSSAAIVAIVGGFITATALSLSAERARLRRLQVNIRGGKGEGNARNQTQGRGEEISPTIIEAVETRLHIEYRSPRFIRWGMFVIAYLAFSGIVLPVIGIGFELFQAVLRSLILVLFCLGIIGLLVYIGWLVKQLK